MKSFMRSGSHGILVLTISVGLYGLWNLVLGVSYKNKACWETGGLPKNKLDVDLSVRTTFISSTRGLSRVYLNLHQS